LKKAKAKNVWIIFSSVVATALLLTVIQAPFGLSFLAWIAWVPFILVCSPRVKGKSFFIIIYVISICYWLGNLYWIGPVTWAGWAAFCLYTAVLWPLLAGLLWYCRIKKLPLFIAAPILIVGAESLQGLFLGGFYWRHLSHSQYANITLIQIADIFGAAGVSFLVAMVNGLIADLIIAGGKKDIFRIANFSKAAFVGAVLAGALFYGRWRINESDKFVTPGPLVASVQTNIPQSVKESIHAEDMIFAELLQNSSASAKAGAMLIVWPETMVQVTLDSRVLNSLGPSGNYSCNIVDRILREHSKDSAYVLVGAYGGTLKDSTHEFEEKYNSAFLYRPDGMRAVEQYDKIHLVPFGEVVPFKKSFPPLFKLLMKFTPYDYDYSLDYGTEYTVFEVKDGGGQNEQVYKFSVMICYEDTVPAVARGFSSDKSGKKRVDWLVNISNDGWFVRFKNGRVCPTTELSEHTAICVFRAVENRLAVLRSVNTGISCLIDTIGRIRNGYEAGTLPKKAMDRKGMAGFFTDRVPIDKRVSFFSRYGQWLDLCCEIVFILLIAASLIEPRLKMRKQRRSRT